MLCYVKNNLEIVISTLNIFSNYYFKIYFNKKEYERFSPFKLKYIFWPNSDFLMCNSFLPNIEIIQFEFVAKTQFFVNFVCIQ